MATQQVTPEKSLTVVEPGALEQSRFLPVMSLATAVARRQTIVEAVKKLMTADTDFGIIPGTAKPTLFQPGADKLNNLFGLVPRFIVMEKSEDWTGEQHGGEPFFAYTVNCQLYRGDWLMGEGIGSCNSWESKYRWRKSERVCPRCKRDTIIKGKEQWGGGWLCFRKRGGCGATFKDGDPVIEGQATGRVSNPDIYDIVNTVMKMAAKRAKIAATLNATSAHEFFTQDVEDVPQLRDEPSAPPEPEPQKSLPLKPELSQLDQILLTFTNRAAIIEAFAQMKGQYHKLVDEEIVNEETYLLILQQHGIDEGTKTYGTIGNAKKAFRALWAEAEKAVGEPPLAPEPSHE